MIPVPKGCFRIQYLIHTYMDFRFLVAMAAVALSVFSSCTKDPLMMNGGGSSEGEAADFDDSAEIVPGWIRIKLADDSEPLRTGVLPAAVLIREMCGSTNSQPDWGRRKSGVSSVTEAVSKNATAVTGSIYGTISESPTKCPFPGPGPKWFRCRVSMSSSPCIA